MSATPTQGCGECGAVLSDPAEWHPYLLCLIKERWPRERPWDVLREILSRLGVELPADPPLIRDVPLARSESEETR